MLDHSNTPIVRLSNIHKRFGANQVLSGIELEIGSGEVVVIIGPSGSGKSTLLRCINLLEVPDQGRIEISGELVFSRDAGAAAPHYKQLDAMAAKARAKTAMVFQRFNLFPHLSVKENVMLGPLRAQGKPARDVAPRAEELIRRVGLADKLDAYPNVLSGGQQQRVAIARALALSPQVMLFDEPTSALDPELVEDVLAVIKQLVLDGMTKIIVTHEMDFAREVGDRIVFIDGGRIVEQGPPSVIFSNPRNPRTQEFLKKVLRRNLNS
jgi:arginine/lysine/histidine transport system ATP-binding protein